MLGRLGAVGSITAYLDSWIDGQITVRRSRQDSSRLRARDEWRKLIIEGKVRYHCRPASLPHGMGNLAVAVAVAVPTTIR